MFTSLTLIGQTPVIDSVSVDVETQLINLSWTYPQSQTADGYIIKRQIWGVPGVVDGTFNTIDTIESATIFQYIDASTIYGNAEPANKPESYRVLPYTIQNDTMVFGYQSIPHTTIQLLAPQYEICSRTITLKWTTYKGWENNIIGYQIFAKTSGSNYELIATNSFMDTIYNHINIIENIDYTYFIKALYTNNLKTSTSNKVGVFSFAPIAPTVFLGTETKIISGEEAEVKFQIQPNEYLQEIKLFRKLDEEENFSEIDILNIENNVVTIDSFTTSSQIANYKLVGFDLCNDTLIESNVLNTILLKGTSPQINQNYLEWNSCNNWAEGVDYYNIYRIIDNNYPEIVATNETDNLSFSENISSFIGQVLNGNMVSGKFCYYIEAVQESTGSNTPFTSASNTVCIAHESEILIPSAFNPNSIIEINRSFKPIVSFVTDYQMIIYNRWGNIIFETDQSFEGWNGTINGNAAENGVYLYWIKYLTSNNEAVEYSGTITLVRTP